MCKVAFNLSLLLLAVGALPFAASGQDGTGPSTSAPDGQDSTVVAVYDGGAVTLGEFERRYARSAGGPEAAARDSMAAYEDFLERYVNFRLKVRAASEAGMEADSAMQQEIAQYRANLARPYLLEQEVLDPHHPRPLRAERADRRRQPHPDPGRAERDARGHPSPPTTSSPPSSTRSRRARDFGEMAARYSEDPSAQRPAGPGSRGRLGYFTAGRMVAPLRGTPPFETAVGELSPHLPHPVRLPRPPRPTTAARPPPDVRVSHILIRPADSTAAAVDSAPRPSRLGPEPDRKRRRLR